MSLPSAPFRKAYSLNGDICISKPTFCYYPKSDFKKSLLSNNNQKLLWFVLIYCNQLFYNI